MKEEKEELLFHYNEVNNLCIHPSKMITFYENFMIGKFLYYLICIVPIPLLIYIIDHGLDWKIYNFLAFRKIEEPEKASHVRIVSEGEGEKISVLEKRQLFVNNKLSNKKYLFIEESSKNYFYDESRKVFIDVDALHIGMEVREFVSNSEFGLSFEQNEHLLSTYGTNTTKIYYESLFAFLVNKFTSPMGAYEIFNVLINYLEDNWVNVFICLYFSLDSVMGEISDLYAYRNKLEDFQKTGKEVIVIRKSDEDAYSKIIVKASSLVPGDLVEITASQIIPADMILIRGSCVTNENALTGQTQNSVKIPVDITSSEHLHEVKSDHILYAGSTCVFTKMQLGQSVFAVVLYTGFNTTKGKLLRSVAFPQKVKIKFWDDAITFIEILAAIAFIGSIWYIYYQAYYLTDLQFTFKTMVYRVIDIINCAVKPTIPFCLYIALSNANDRLISKEIYSSNKFKINEGGRINTVCFDKTGTLTESFSTTEGFIVTDMLASPPTLLPHMSTSQELFSNDKSNSHFKKCMAFCNNLLRIGKKSVGDPLELEMLKYSPYDVTYDTIGDQLITQYILNDPQIDEFEDKSSYRLVRILDSVTFGFMSVIVADQQGRHFVYSKGAPEIVLANCNKASVPTQTMEVLNNLTMKGFRILSLAYKPLSDKEKDEEINSQDKKLIFLGFYLIENPTRPSAAPVIQTLMENYIRCIMVTGDNMLTSIHVANSCGMIPLHKKVIILSRSLEEDTKDIFTWNILENRHSILANSSNLLAMTTFLEDSKGEYLLAMTGESFIHILQYSESLDEKTKISFLNTIESYCQVYARINFEQKKELMEFFKRGRTSKYLIAYIGDGANDIEAIKKADIGIMFGESEISASSTFTSRKQDLNVILDIIKEGKVCMTNGMANFQFFLVFILNQFFGMMMLYTVYIGYRNNHGIFLDLAVLYIFGLVIADMKPSEKMTPLIPKTSIFYRKMVISILLTVLISWFTMLYGWFSLTNLEFYDIPLRFVSQADFEDKSIDQNVYSFYDNHYVFITIVCFNMTYFFVSNFRNKFRSSLFKMPQELLKISLVIAFVGYLAVMSENDSFSWWEDVLADIFGVLRTFQTTKIYLVNFLIFFVGCFFVEKLSNMVQSIHEFRSMKKTDADFLKYT